MFTSYGPLDYSQVIYIILTDKLVCYCTFVKRKWLRKMFHCAQLYSQMIAECNEVVSL